MAVDPWDLDYVEASVRRSLVERRGWSPMGVGRGVSGEHLDYFGSVMPASLLHIWKSFGFEGFGQGRYWITDPFQWEAVVAAWLDGVTLPFPDQKWWCISRTAMGEMKLWGEVSGPALDISPALSTIYPKSARAQSMADAGRRQIMGCSAFAIPINDDAFLDARTGRSLVDGAVRRLGPVGGLQVYGLTPAYCLSGHMSLSQVSIEDAVSHLVMLSQLQAPTLAQDFSARATALAADIAASQSPQTGNTTPGGGGDPVS